MNQMTLDLIHRAYQESVQKSDNILDIVKNLYEILSEETVVEEDSACFDAFLDALRDCYHTRKNTFQITNTVCYINSVLMYIILWLNDTHQYHIDIDLKARRKSLESDLTKILRKSIDKDNNLSVTILDRFGLRGIVNNTFPESENIKYLYLIFDSICGILADQNRQMRRNFMNWINASNINRFDKCLIMEILKTPFSITHQRDYVKNPKKNGYQSLHLTMVFTNYSDVLPGCSLELQLRTKRMNDEAEFGSASHLNYKKYQNEIPYDDIVEGELENTVTDDDIVEEELENPVTKVFIIEDFTNIKNPRLGLDVDADGVNHSKNFLNRSLSTTLVPKL